MNTVESQAAYAPEPLEKTPDEQKRDVLQMVHKHMNRDAGLELSEEQSNAA